MNEEISILKYYVYYHCDPVTTIPFYVGKGCGERSHILYGRSKAHQNWILNLKKQGLKPLIIVGNRYSDENEAYAAERADIHVLKCLGDNLFNKKLNDKNRETGNKLKPIVCTTTNEVFSSIVSASEKLQIRSNAIVAVLKGRQNVTKNLSFRYVDEKLNRIADKKRKQSAINKKYQCAKSLICNETGETFVFIKDVAEKLNVCPSYISDYFKYPNRIKHIKGFTFRRAK